MRGLICSCRYACTALEANRSTMGQMTTQTSRTLDPPWQNSADPLSPGSTIGRFVVLGTLGTGGMSVVLSAYDPVLERKVAIKQLRSERWSGELTWGRVRLMAEAQVMARLSHPNVVAVHEIVSTDDGAILVMEHI